MTPNVSRVQNRPHILFTFRNSFLMIYCCHNWNTSTVTIFEMQALNSLFIYMWGPMFNSSAVNANLLLLSIFKCNYLRFDIILFSLTVGNSSNASLCSVLVLLLLFWLLFCSIWNLNKRIWNMNAFLSWGLYVKGY